MRTRLISQNDVQEVLRAVGRDEFMLRVIEALERELVDLGLGKTAYPPARDGFTRESPAPGVLEWMPYAAQTDTATIKTVAYSPANPDRYALPTILGTLTRYDMVTGRLLAIADGVLLTAIRTGAASAVATRLLAAQDSSVLGLVGAGAQAVTQLHALSKVLPVRQVLVTDQNPARAESLAARAAFLDLDLDVRLATPAEVMAESDVICTATSAAPGVPPVLPDGAHRPHLHVNAVGSDLVGKTELARSTLERAVVVPDHPSQAALEGECQQLVGTAAATAIGPSLGELCADPVLAEPLRHRLTVFDSTGFALEDHVALDVLLAVADGLGLGTDVQFEHHPRDVVNPYSAITG